MKNTLSIASFCLPAALSLVMTGCVASLEERFAETVDAVADTNRTVLAARLKPVLDDVSVTGRVIVATTGMFTFSGDSLTNKFPGEVSGVDDYKYFIKNCNDCDIFFTLSLEPGSRSNISHIVQIDVPSIHCEAVAYAWKKNPSGGTPIDRVFPGWRDEKWYLTFNGKPFWPSQTNEWNSLIGARVRVRGVLALDCPEGHVEGCEPTPDTSKERSNVEIHPIYEIEVLRTK